MESRVADRQSSAWSVDDSRVTTLKLSGQGIANVARLEQELVTAVADKLRDEHGYELRDFPSADGSEADHEYRLFPAGGIVVHHHPRALMVKLRGVDDGCPRSVHRCE
jgi:hypothetical protein